ncbi:MAG: hypothetical protein P0116_11295 [Candidatus Nitrosocosmicus sp.]|nr:hypothetical protein [Candidatus Nitrosocosmicus sp.]
MPKEKDKVITLRISETDFRIVDNFAKDRGLSVSAYITSVIKSQTEYFIPLSSTEKVSIPKEALNSLFSFTSHNNLDELSDQWALELKHVVQLIWGDLNLQTTLDVIAKVSKYLLGTDARIISNSNFTKDSRYKERREMSTILNHSDIIRGTNGSNTSDAFWIVIRHNLGANCSYFWNKMFIQFLGYIHDSVDFVTQYDDTTISIKIKVK